MANFATYGGDGASMGMGGMEDHSASGGSKDKKWETNSEMSQCYGPIRLNKNDTLEVEGEIDIHY
jgi:hypothetical protein